MPLLASLMLFLSVAAGAQEGSQNRGDSSAKKPSLEFKLIALTPTVCVGVPLKLRLEVTNVGQETVKLNKAYFWNVYAVSPTTPESEKSDKEVFLTYIWPRSTSEDIFFLAPGKTYIDHTYWSLEEKSTQLGAGNYTLETGHYGSSNKLQFEIHDCERKELKGQ
jgi:hypothetical protein